MVEIFLGRLCWQWKVEDSEDDRAARQTPFHKEECAGKSRTDRVHWCRCIQHWLWCSHCLLSFPGLSQRRMEERAGWDRFAEIRRYLARCTSVDYRRHLLHRHGFFCVHAYPRRARQGAKSVVRPHLYESKLNRHEVQWHESITSTFGICIIGTNGSKA